MKQNGNMYKFINNNTWNPLHGQCKHECTYCYVNRMKRFPVVEEKYTGEYRLADNYKKNLKKNKFWFVQSMGDLFEENVTHDMIENVLDHCMRYPSNTYLFQTKNPFRFSTFIKKFRSLKSVLCTTIETNRYTNTISKAPHPGNRAYELGYMNSVYFKTMVTIEPIMDFDLKELLDSIKFTGAYQVNIGADSGNNKLFEPSKEKTLELISELEKFTKVVTKDNLTRLIGI